MAKFEGRVVIKRKNIVQKNLNFSEIICWSTRKICYLKIPCGKGLSSNNVRKYWKRPATFEYFATEWSWYFFTPEQSDTLRTDDIHLPLDRWKQNPQTLFRRSRWSVQTIVYHSRGGNIWMGKLASDALTRTRLRQIERTGIVDDFEDFFTGKSRGSLNTCEPKTSPAYPVLLKTSWLSLAGNSVICILFLDFVRFVRFQLGHFSSFVLTPNSPFHG